LFDGFGFGEHGFDAGDWGGFSELFVGEILFYQRNSTLLHTGISWGWSSRPARWRDTAEPECRRYVAKRPSVAVQSERMWDMGFWPLVA